MSDGIIQLAGWLPAIIFPMACFIQLLKIYHHKNAEGVSVLAWIAFGLANISLYIYAEKYDSWQTIIGMLGQSVIDFTIAGATLFYRQSRA